MESIKLLVIQDSEEVEKLLLTLLCQDIITIIRKDQMLDIIVEQNKISIVREKLGMGKIVATFKINMLRGSGGWLWG